MKELKFEELSLKQKLGMALIAFIENPTPDQIEYTLNLIRNHSLGGVWVQWQSRDSEKYVKMIKETADYPILIFTDAESGIYDYQIGRHNAIGCTDSEKHAYIFGKAVGVAARKTGYNVVCNPLLDIGEDGNVRTISGDKKKIAILGAAIARGMHDAGVLTVAKHYPSDIQALDIDSHMAEGYSEQTKEELIDQSLYAYRELMKENLLDGIMTGHHKIVKIDPDRPASLSKKVIGVIREIGFDGFALTDALCMMGIRSRYGDVESKGLCIEAGNDFALPYTTDTIFNYEAMCTCYEKGIISDEALDRAVKNVLNAQHKTLKEPLHTALTDEDEEIFNSINRDGVFAKCDEGLTPSISRDGKHYFSIMINNETQITDGKVEVDTFNNEWWYPTKIKKRILELFPNSKVEFIHQYPSPWYNKCFLEHSLDCEDIVFLTYTEPLTYVGREHFTHRIVSVVEAAQFTNRISTVVHFGNPTILEELAHISRYIVGGMSEASVNACLDVLAGKYPAKGRLTYNVNFK